MHRLRQQADRQLRLAGDVELNDGPSTVAAKSEAEELDEAAASGTMKCDMVPRPTLTWKRHLGPCFVVIWSTAEGGCVL
jgi:hypothetical protein